MIVRRVAECGCYISGRPRHPHGFAADVSACHAANIVRNTISKFRGNDAAHAAMPSEGSILHLQDRFQWQFWTKKLVKLKRTVPQLFNEIRISHQLPMKP